MTGGVLKGVILGLLSSSVAFCDPSVLGFRKVYPEEAINPVAYQIKGGAAASSETSTEHSYWKSLYFAFAVDARFFSECSATSKTALCTFLKSSLDVSGNFSWKKNNRSEQYKVILVPIEYVSGRFGKEGLDLRNTSSAFYFDFRFSAEYLRDLGLEVEHKVNALVSSSLNYTNPVFEAGEDIAFRWIGSARIFAGSSANKVLGSEAVKQGAMIGFEGKSGIALDLAYGTISLIYTGRFQGDSDFQKNGYSATLSEHEVELRYLYSVCESSDNEEKEFKCKRPRTISFGGGVKYQYSTFSYDDDQTNFHRKNDFHRLIFFAEISKF